MTATASALERAIESLEAVEAGMPPWWSPEQREAWRFRAENNVVHGEALDLRFKSLQAINEARTPGCAVERITADLNTGAEVPA